MKIADRIGNELREGQAIFWVPTGLVAKVKSIEAGGISTPDGPTQPRIIIEIGLNITPVNGFAVTRLADFVITSDPSQVAHTLSILEKAANSRKVQ